MTAAYPETPEAVAWELTLAISEAEGRPIRRRPGRKGNGGMNQPPREYVLDLAMVPDTPAQPHQRI